MKTLQQKSGFTLAELLIVIAIVAALVAIAIPAFHSQREKANQAVDMATMRAAYSVLMQHHLDGTVRADGKTVYYFDADGATVGDTRPAKGYGKSSTSASEWWTGVGSAIGTPNSGTPAVLQMTLSPSGAVTFIWGSGAYTGLKVSDKTTYSSLTPEERVKRDKALLDGIQSELHNMTYGQLHEMFFNGTGLRGDFAGVSYTGTSNGDAKQPLVQVVDGRVCVTLAESTIRDNAVSIGTKDRNHILTPSLFTAAGYDISADETQNYLITSVSDNRTNARIWADLGIRLDTLSNLTPESEEWNQKADKSFTYIKGAGAVTDPVISHDARRDAVRKQK